MKRIKKYFDGNIIQRNDATKVNIPIITNIPLDNSLESKFYRDLAYLSAATLAELKAEDNYNRATNQGVYLHTVKPTNVAARTGHMEIDPRTGDVIGYTAPTTVSAAPLTEGLRMWMSPAFLLALSIPTIDLPFIFKGLSPKALPKKLPVRNLKAITSVGNKAKNTGQTISNVKRVYSAPKANIIPVKSTITTSDVPTITAENAASITPELWTVAQDAAIARGDMIEAQRLRDLHFKVKAPNSKIVDKNGNPIHSYHGTGKHFNEFDTTGKYSTLDEGYYGVGAYFSPNKELAQIYADTEKTPIVYDTYLNIKNPLRHVVDENTDLYGRIIVDNDGVISTLPDDLVDGTFDMTEYVATKPNQIKLANAVTYSDDGVRIGLGNRDNFNNPDIRYGLLPFVLGGGYKYVNQDNNSIKYANGGKLIKRIRK